MPSACWLKRNNKLPIHSLEPTVSMESDRAEKIVLRGSGIEILEYEEKFAYVDLPLGSRVWCGGPKAGV